MRVLFTCTPGAGHFHPLVPIARALEDAGHEVAFATPSPFVGTVERAGFRAFPAGLAKTVAEAFPEVLGLRGREETMFVLGHVRPAQAAAMAQDLLDLIPNWRPDLIVRETAEFGGCIAAARLGIPYAVVEIRATGFGEEQRSWFAPGLAVVLEQHGLQADPELSILEGQLILSPFPPSYRGTPTGIAATRWLSTRPTPFDQSGDEGAPSWLDGLPVRPTAFLTLGTSLLFNTRTSVFRAFIDGLADEPLNLIVALGRNNDPASFAPTPPNVWMERYIPQTLVFSRCDLVICHGGSGSVMAALAHGLPLVLVPIGADQPENSRRCAALGVAHVLNEDTLNPIVARAAVRDVLVNPSYRQNAERLRAEIEGLPSPERAVTLLERFVAGLNPILD